MVDEDIRSKTFIESPKRRPQREKRKQVEFYDPHQVKVLRAPPKTTSKAPPKANSKAPLKANSKAPPKANSTAPKAPRGKPPAKSPPTSCKSDKKIATSQKLIVINEESEKNQQLNAQVSTLNHQLQQLATQNQLLLEQFHQQQNISSTEVIVKKVPVVPESNFMSSSNEVTILNERLKKLEREKEDLANNNALRLNHSSMSSYPQSNSFNNINNMMQMNNNNNMMQMNNNDNMMHMYTNQIAPAQMMYGNGYNQNFPHMMMSNNNNNNQERTKKSSTGSGFLLAELIGAWKDYNN